MRIQKFASLFGSYLSGDLKCFSRRSRKGRISPCIHEVLERRLLLSADYSVQDSLVVGVGPHDSTTGLCTVSIKGKIHNVGDASGSLLDLQFSVTESQDAVYGNGDDGLHGSLLLDVETVSLAPDAFSSTDGALSLQVHPDNHYLIFHLLSTEGPIDSNSANDTFAIPIGTPSVSTVSAKSVRPHKTVLLDPSANLSDPNSVDFNGGKISVQFSAGADPKNAIFLQKSGTGSSQLKVSNGRLLLGKTRSELWLEVRTAFPWTSRLQPQHRRTWSVAFSDK